MKTIRLAISACLCAALMPRAVAGQTSKEQTAKDYDKRAREIVSEMTLDEKLSELHGIRDAAHDRYVLGIPRLGIPELRITNGPAGAGPDGVGPQPKATAWYPGEEDGNAVAAVLFGEVNPSGKLPITFPKRVEDTFAANREEYPGIHKVVKYSEGLYVGYRYYDEQKIEPLFPFGFGLSYTRFAFRNLRVSPPSAAHWVEVEFDLANTGAVVGAEVAQVYVAMPSSAAVPQPPKQLKAFQKVMINPGESTHVRLTLNERAFQYWDVTSHGWKTAPGTYGVMVGSSSRDLPLKAEIRIGQ